MDQVTLYENAMPMPMPMPTRRAPCMPTADSPRLSRWQTIFRQNQQTNKVIYGRRNMTPIAELEEQEIKNARTRPDHSNKNALYMDVAAIQQMMMPKNHTERIIAAAIAEEELLPAAAVDIAAAVDTEIYDTVDRPDNKKEVITIVNENPSKIITIYTTMETQIRTRLFSLDQLLEGDKKKELYVCTTLEEMRHVMVAMNLPIEQLAMSIQTKDEISANLLKYEDLSCILDFINVHVNRLYKNRLIKPSKYSNTKTYARILQNGLLYIPQITAEICALAVKYNPTSIKNIPFEFKTQALCKEAVREFGIGLQYVPEHLKTAELCELAFKSSGVAIHYMPSHLITPDMIKTLETDRAKKFNLFFVPDYLKTEKICRVAAEFDWAYLYYVPETYDTEGWGTLV